MDQINNPVHYTKGKIQVWDFILDQSLPFLEGNIIKYVCRARYKGNYIEDMEKVIAYANKCIDEERRNEHPMYLISEDGEIKQVKQI